MAQSLVFSCRWLVSVTVISAGVGMTYFLGPPRSSTSFTEYLQGKTVTSSLLGGWGRTYLLGPPRSFTEYLQGRHVRVISAGVGMT